MWTRTASATLIEQYYAIQIGIEIGTMFFFSACTGTAVHEEYRKTS